PLVEVYHYNLVQVLAITIPASIVGIFVMSLVMSRHGKDLEQDEEYRRRVAAGEVQEPASSDDIVIQQYAKRSVAIFLGAVLVICLFGLFEGIRPTVATEDGGFEPLAGSCCRRTARRSQPPRPTRRERRRSGNA